MEAECSRNLGQVSDFPSERKYWKKMLGFAPVRKWGFVRASIASFLRIDMRDKRESADKRVRNGTLIAAYGHRLQMPAAEVAGWLC